jgi:hypothetical protein
VTFNVTVGPNTAEVYGGITACIAYLSWNSDAAAQAFANLSTDDQSKRLVDATRWIDRKVWAGAPTTPAVGGTTLQWPRTGVTVRVNNAIVVVDPNTVPVDVVNGCFELAALAAADPSVLTAASTASNVQSLQAGSAGIGFFQPTSLANGTATLFPTIIEQLLAKYRPGGTSTGSSRAGTFAGADGCSRFDDCAVISRKIPF